MEKMSRINWMLTGIRPKEGETLPEETVNRMLNEAFLDGVKYDLFLCGGLVDKQGTLEEMEDGLELVASDMDEYQVGDYGIISNHSEGSLLFFPVDIRVEDSPIIETEEDAQIFIDAIVNPPSPNENLIEAMDKYKKFKNGDA